MTEPPVRPLGCGRLWLGCGIFAAIGVAVMVYLHGSGLTSASSYHLDLTQSPHWVAYHGDAFAEDDLLIQYATYNESPVQNAIYWVGTRFVDVVLLNKIVGIAIFGLTAALFFALVSSTSGSRTGVLASLFFVIFPRSTYEIAGGFSKAWATGLVLVAVYLVETRKWRVLLWLMPLAALAYPVSAVMIGAIVLAGLVIEFPRAVPGGLRGLKYLAMGSVFGLVPLLYKYITPPARIGEMISAAVMKSMWERGISSSVTLPLWEEVLEYVEHPFFIYSTFLLAMLLFRRGLVWKRSWSALVAASVVCYFVADLVVPRLYLPDRYARFSMAVLLVLWCAHNWAHLLEFLKHRWAHRAALAAVVVLAAGFFSDTFKPCDGDQSLGMWEDRDYAEAMSRVIASEPSPVLVAGQPYHLSDIMVQSRRPVLVIHRMFHPWFSGYHREVDGRIRDTFRALYARKTDDVNELVSRYGVTHLLVLKRDYRSSRRRNGKIYKSQYNSFIARLARDPDDFVLNPPPQDAVLYEDDDFWIVRLPLEGGR